MCHPLTLIGLHIKCTKSVQGKGHIYVKFFSLALSALQLQFSGI